MSQVRLNFLNFQPDQEDYQNDGLITADNVLHAEEGYLEYKTNTVGAFATNPGMGTSTPSVIIKTAGTNDQRAIAYLHNATAAGAGFTIDMSVGLMASNYSLSGLYTTVTSATILTASTLNAISGFDVCELGGEIFFSAHAELQSATVLSGAALVTLNLTGYGSI